MTRSCAQQKGQFGESERSVNDSAACTRFSIGIRYQGIPISFLSFYIRHWNRYRELYQLLNQSEILVVSTTKRNPYNRQNINILCLWFKSLCKWVESRPFESYITVFGVSVEKSFRMNTSILSTTILQFELCMHYWVKTNIFIWIIYFHCICLKTQRKRKHQLNNRFNFISFGENKPDEWTKKSRPP